MSSVIIWRMVTLICASSDRRARVPPSPCRAPSPSGKAPTRCPRYPMRLAAQPASGMRDAVRAVDASIGGTVSPAPPNAPSSTISGTDGELRERGDSQVLRGFGDHGCVAREQRRELARKSELENARAPRRASCRSPSPSIPRARRDRRAPRRGSGQRSPPWPRRIRRRS